MKKAFVDTTGLLKAHGWMSGNDPGDVEVPVPDDFDKAVGEWKWTGTEWVPRPRDIATEKHAEAQKSMDTPVVKALLRALLDEIDARHPGQPVDRSAVRQRAVGYLKDLL